MYTSKGIKLPVLHLVFFLRAGLLPGDLFGGFSFLVDRVEYDYK
jgi:hypothetical protein